VVYCVREHRILQDAIVISRSMWYASTISEIHEKAMVFH